MINVVVYLHANHDPSVLFDALLMNDLVATISIDKENRFFKRNGQTIEEIVHTVITMQTRALLFSEICRIVTDRFGENVPIHSVPIVAANLSFENQIKRSTKEPDDRIVTVLNH